MKDKFNFRKYDNGIWKEVQVDDEFIILPAQLHCRVTEIKENSLIVETEIKDKIVIIPLRMCKK